MSLQKYIFFFNLQSRVIFFENYIFGCSLKADIYELNEKKNSEEKLLNLKKVKCTISVLKKIVFLQPKKYNVLIYKQKQELC